MSEPKNYGTIFEIAAQMIKSGLPSKFVDRVQDHAKEFEGTFNLMVLWQQETEQEEKNAIIADLQEAIDREKRMNWLNEGFRELAGTEPDVAFGEIEGEDFK